MNYSRNQQGNLWIGTIALLWIVLLIVMWILHYTNFLIPRWSGIIRVAKEFILLGGVLGAVYGWGRVILAQLYAQPNEQLNMVWVFGLGFGVLWIATFVVSALHLLHPVWPWILIIGGWLAFIRTMPPPRLRLPIVPSTTIHWFFLIVMICSLSYSLLTWSLIPPLAWDEVSYHLPIPLTFIEAKGFVSIPTIVHSNWPSGMEMLNVLALMMGSEILPHLIVTAMTVLTAIGLACFAQRYFDHDTAWLAATIYLTIPMVKNLAGLALIEGALGFFGFLAIWAGYGWIKEGSWRDLFLAGVLGGLAASIKLTGAAIPLIIGITGLVGLLLHQQYGLKRSILQFTIYGSTVLIVVMPWYLKSIIYTGNPIWPFLYTAFGGRDWDILGERLHMAWLHDPNIAPTIWNYIKGLWYLTVRSTQFGGYRLGPLILLAPLSLLFWRRNYRLMEYLILVSWGIYTIWFFTTHQTRFLMGMVPVLVLLAAYATNYLLCLWPSCLAALGKVALVVYFTTVLPFVDGRQWDLIANRWPYIAGHISRDEFLMSHVDAYPAFQYANDNLPQDAKVLLAIWETREYYLDRNAVWANPIGQRVIKWEKFKNVRTLARFLRSLGITHVFWNRNLAIEDVTKKSSTDSVITEAIANEIYTDQLLRNLSTDCGEIIYESNGFIIYKLHMCSRKPCRRKKVSQLCQIDRISSIGRSSTKLKDPSYRRGLGVPHISDGE
jgi:hypothetical protein